MGKRAQELCTDEAIDKVMHLTASCECSKNCLAAWKAKLGDSVARAIVKTERHAFGAMTRYGRFCHYSAIIKSRLHMKTAMTSNGDGVINTGERIEGSV